MYCNIFFSLGAPKRRKKVTGKRYDRYVIENSGKVTSEVQEPRLDHHHVRARPPRNPPFVVLPPKVDATLEKKIATKGSGRKSLLVPDDFTVMEGNGHRAAGLVY